jgi:hypothetical protein
MPAAVQDLRLLEAWLVLPGCASAPLAVPLLCWRLLLLLLLLLLLPLH